MIDNNNKQAKLTLAQVEEISTALEEGVKGCVLAKKYGVSNTQIHRIKHKKAWQSPKPCDPYATAGAGNGMAKLTREQVAAVMAELKEGKRGKFLAEKYQVSPATISHIKNQKSWLDTTTTPGDWRPSGRQY